MRIRAVLALSLVLIVLLSSSCAVFSGNSSSFDNRLRSLTQPYSFNMIEWEVKTLSYYVKHTIINPQLVSVQSSRLVINYFYNMARMQSLQSDIQAIRAGNSEGDLAYHEAQLRRVEEQINAFQLTAERIIARQISEILASQGIFNPVSNSFPVIFPPVYFTLEDPLYVLVTSPRDRIERLKDVTLSQDISLEQMQELEASVDELDVSSLAVKIGGLAATYPTFVLNTSDLRWTIETAVHEWLHQYLTFKPIGFYYAMHLLGLINNPEIPTLNETVVNLAAKELGDLVYERFYAPYLKPQIGQEAGPAVPVFDFNAAMRDIRRNVDAYLAQGRIEQAEQYMEEQRRYLMTEGYYIRKLNQAYFAFYGSYADSPTSIDPIGDDLRLLRQRSPSVRDFLDVASGFISTQDLADALSGFGEQ